MGQTDRGDAVAFAQLEGGALEGAVHETVMGTYLHGLFDTGELTERLAVWLAERRGLDLDAWQPVDRRRYREEQYDALASVVRAALDMEAVYAAMDAYGA